MMALTLLEPKPAAAPPVDTRLTSYRTWDKLTTPDLLVVKGKIDSVIDDRARQRDLFAAPEPEPAQEVPTTHLGAVLSPSQVNTYLGCSARWWFRYGCGLPDPPSASLVRGRVVHKVAETWFRAQLAGERVEADDMEAPFEESWRKEAEEARFADVEEMETTKRQTAVLARKYIDEAAPEIRPAAMEVPVNGTIAGVPVRGFIDLLDVDGRIIDLKTAARKPSGVSADYALQLATYKQLEPRANGQVRLDTLVATKTPQLVTIPYTVSMADQFHTQHMYPLVQEGIHEGLFFPNRSANLCSKRTCSFWQACQKEFGGAVKGAEE